MNGRSWSNGNEYRYGFNGQEKSDDVAKGNTTAEFWEYDSRIGRRWNVDPQPRIWESVYLAFGGNPISNSDVKGDFWITDHFEIDRIAYQRVFGGIVGTGITLLKMIKTTWIEVKYKNRNASHLDNMDNESLSTQLKAGAYKKLDSHQLQDFYSHSNYVEILKENGVEEENMVTFDKLDKNSDLYKDVMSKIETTTYPTDKKKIIKKNNHDGEDVGTYEQFASGEREAATGSDHFMAKDANGSKKYKKFKHPLHEVAKRLATEATIIKFQAVKDKILGGGKKEEKADEVQNKKTGTN